MKLARTRVALACAMSLACASAAAAQALDTLHVRSFGMSTDTSRPQVGQPFRLTIQAHVDEQITQLDNVTLPDLSSFDTQGDERRCTATNRGSDCSETIVLIPKVQGSVTVDSATMDAIDASDKKADRFATNSLHLQIGGPPFAFSGTGYLADLFWNTLRAFVLLLALVVILWYVLYRVTRPRAPKGVIAPVAQPAPAMATPRPIEDFETQFRTLVDALRAEPNRPRALAVRHALRYALGAHEKETLADLVRRNAAGDRPQRIAALRAIERASFCEDANVEENAREALPLLTL